MPDIKRVAVDITETVTSVDAARLCAHHLMLAAAYFEASPRDCGLLINQHLRAMENEGGQQAAGVWVAYIYAYYAEMAKAEEDMHDD